MYALTLIPHKPIACNLFQTLVSQETRGGNLLVSSTVHSKITFLTNKEAWAIHDTVLKHEGGVME